jgi:glycosyltransferase involved in cell wall biosynthesis
MHDLAWLDGHQWYSRSYRLGQRLLVSRATKLARQIFTVSDYSAMQIEKRLQIASSRLTVVRNGVGASSSAIGGPGAIGRNSTSSNGKRSELTALFVGTLVRRKNLLGVWHAFRRIRQEKGLDVHLVVVGAPRDGKALTSDLKADPDVVFLHYVDDERLVELYREAAFLVMPSFYEGFGLPIIEAMALGTPVITSTTSALAEVAGDAAILVNPYDDEQIYGAMLRLFTDAHLRAQLGDRGRDRARCFAWESSAQVALGALRTLMPAEGLPVS